MKISSLRQRAYGTSRYARPVLARALDRALALPRAVLVGAVTLIYLAMVIAAVWVGSGPAWPAMLVVFAFAFGIWGGPYSKPMLVVCLDIALLPIMQQLLHAGDIVPVLRWGSLFVTYAVFASMIAPVALIVDRATRSRTVAARGWFDKIPYAMPVVYGLSAVASGVATVIWTLSIGDGNLATIEGAVLAGVAVTTLAAIREDRSRPLPDGRVNATVSTAD